MSLNRSTTDQDERPFIRCSACKQLAKCYRGPRIKQVETEAGTFDHWKWWCPTCLSKMVTEALRES